jgi:predicted MFS family arabinose efflux permease
LGVLGGFSFALFYAVFGLLIGRLADKYNRVWIMTGSLALWSLASAACGLAKNFGGLFLARMGVGVGEAGCVPAGHSLIGDYFPPRKRALAVSLFTGVGTIGSLVGLVFGAALAEIYGWRTVFVIFGLPGLAFALLLRLLLREPQRGRFDKVHQQPPQKFFAALSRLLSRSTARHLLIGIPLYYVGVGASVWIPSYFLRAHGITIGEFGATGGLALGLGTVLGTFGGGYLVNWLMRYERRWEFWWPTLASLISVPLLALAYSLAATNLAYIFLFAGTLAMASGIGASMSCLQVVAEPALRAMAVGLMLLGTSLIGYGAGPVLVGMLSDWFAAAIDGANGASLRFGLL